MIKIKETKNCKICNEEVKESSHFYKNHQIAIKDYYEKYFPKKDLITGENIPFKTYESYLLTDFLDRRHLKKWTETHKREDVIDYLTEWLNRRKEIKNLKSMLGQFESRSLCFPAVSYLLNKYSVNFLYELCTKVNLKEKYNYSQIINLEEPREGVHIQIDTREVQPLRFNDCKVSITKLDAGDYTSIATPDILIERKSLNDLCGTMSKGYERFAQELNRAKQNNKYVVVVIETKYSNLQIFNKFNYMHYTKVSPEFLFKRIRDTYLDYGDNIQFLAVDGRGEAARVVKNIFCLKNDIKTVDLQYFYDITKI